ncbi:MAG TPA: IS3 family transposase [Candidatus Limnocylindrales bacterium]
MSFRLVQDLAGDGVPVAVACRILRVSRSGYHAWSTRRPSARAVADEQLTGTIMAIHEMSRRSYGAPRVHAELRLGMGMLVGRKRVARLMHAAGISGIAHRRKRGRHHPAPAPHEDLVKRRFVADAPDRLWCTDITEHPTGTGKVYCAAVMDVFSRQIVGWSIADHIRAELVVDALQMATWKRRPEPGTIVHADRGAQYTSWVFGHRLREAGLLGSMGRVRLVRGQHDDRVVLVDDAARAARHPPLGHKDRAGLGDLRVDRGLVQPPPAPLEPGRPVPGRVRKPSHRRDRGSMINQPKPSAKAGQAPLSM